MKIGVLALQGDVREHIQSLSDCGVDALAVKTKSEIENISALVIPGGESTTIAKLARSFDLFDLIKDRIKGGMPTYGSCAGMILISDVVEDAIIGQESFGGIDMVVKRNAFGRQVDSFETALTGGSVIPLNFKSVSNESTCRPKALRLTTISIPPKLSWPIIASSTTSDSKIIPAQDP